MRNWLIPVLIFALFLFGIAQLRAEECQPDETTTADLERRIADVESLVFGITFDQDERIRINTARLERLKKQLDALNAVGFQGL